MNTLIVTICNGLSSFLTIFTVLLTVRIYLTWFPNVNFYSQPFYSLGKVTDPYLRIFRGILPPLIGFDLSPIVGFLLLTFLSDALRSMATTFT